MKSKNDLIQQQEALTALLKMTFYTGVNKALELVESAKDQKELEQKLETAFRLHLIDLQHTHEKTSSRKNGA